MEVFNEIVKQIDMDGNIYEVAIVKEFDMLDFTIGIEGNKTPYNLKDNKIRFPHDFYISQIELFSETNDLAGFLLNIGGIMYPSKSYYLDKNTTLVQKGISEYMVGFKATTTLRRYADLNIQIRKGDLLKFYVYNAHSLAQKIYVNLIGYRIYKRVLKPVL